MTPVAWSGTGYLLCFVAEQFFYLMPALLQAAQRQPERGHAVPYHVVGVIAAERHQQGLAARRGRLEAMPGQLSGELGHALLDFDRQDLPDLSEAGHRGGPEQPPALDRHQVVA